MSSRIRHLTSFGCTAAAVEINIVLMIIYLNADKGTISQRFWSISCLRSRHLCTMTAATCFSCARSTSSPLPSQGVGAIQFHHWQVPCDRTCWRVLPSALSSWLAREPVNIVYFSNGHCWRWFCWMWFRVTTKLVNPWRIWGLMMQFVATPHNWLSRLWRGDFILELLFWSNFLVVVAPLEPSGKPYSINCGRYRNIPQFDRLHEACISSCSWAIRGRVVQDFFHEDIFECFHPMLQVASFSMSKEKCWVISEPIRDEPLILNWNDVQCQFITILRQGRFIIMRKGDEGNSHETKTTTASFVSEPASQGAITNMLGLLLQDDEKIPVLTMMLSDEPNQLLRWQAPLPQSETSSGRLTAWRDPKIVGDILCCVNAKGITTMSTIFDWNFQVYPSLSGSNAWRSYLSQVLMAWWSLPKHSKARLLMWFLTTSFADLNGLSGKPSNLS